MLELLENRLIHYGIHQTLIPYLVDAIAITALLLITLSANYLAKYYVVSIFNGLISKPNRQWNQAFLRRKVLNRIANFVPPFVLYTLMPLALSSYDSFITLINKVLFIYMIVMLTLLLDAILNTIKDSYQYVKITKNIPIAGILQVTQIVVYFLSIIFIVSILLDKTPIYLLSGIGALTAVLLLIFRDTILGFVAGIQLAANKMVSVGDWIEMPKFGADGDVLDVTLTTVKVQNWDKTITTIPTYSLISESFKNWRGMAESGGRRIKRAINIDMNSIRFCDEGMLQRYAKIQYISAYIEKKTREFEQFNQFHQVDDSRLANGRRMTNVGTFRAYMGAYLRNHPLINQEMTFLIRQLDPTQYGLPIEIYIFTTEKDWTKYEAIQSNIFDHLLAVVTEFDLRVYQNPTGADFQQLTR